MKTFIKQFYKESLCDFTFSFMEMVFMATVLLIGNLFLVETGQFIISQHTGLVMGFLAVLLLLVYLGSIRILLGVLDRLLGYQCSLGNALWQDFLFITYVSYSTYRIFSINIPFPPMTQPFEYVYSVVSAMVLVAAVTLGAMVIITGLGRALIEHVLFTFFVKKNESERA